MFSNTPRSNTFVIAECGVNHNGKLSEALKLADAAKWAGADAAKFQLFSSQRLWGDDRIKHLELSDLEIAKVWTHCREIGIEFMCTPFDHESVFFLKHMLKRVKIASGCIARRPILKAAEETGLPVILSTGMATMSDVGDALRNLGKAEVTLLHCTSSYPCRLEDVNLKAMDALAAFNRPVGYSDHTAGITIALAAVARGAVVIEKHLTLDREQEGPDHKASITPREFNAMRVGIIELEAALGDGKKRVMPSEEKLRAVWRG